MTTPDTLTPDEQHLTDEINAAFTTLEDVARQVVRLDVERFLDRLAAITETSANTQTPNTLKIARRGWSNIFSLCEYVAMLLTVARDDDNDVKARYAYLLVDAEAARP